MREIVKVRKVAGSMVISLPKELLEQSGLREHDFVQVFSQAGSLRIQISLFDRRVIVPLENS